MTLAQAFDDTREVRSIPTAELKAELAAFVAAKCWSSTRYYQLDREVQRRAVNAWVHDDVFGNTFAPLDV